MQRSSYKELLIYRAWGTCVSIGIEFEYANVPWEPKTLIGGLVTHQLISSFVVGDGSLIDGSQNAVWPLAVEDEFRRIMSVIGNIFLVLSAISYIYRRLSLVG